MIKEVNKNPKVSMEELFRMGTNLIMEATIGSRVRKEKDTRIAIITTTIKGDE